MLDSDFVEILMAVYNGEDYLEDQILSIINQTHENWSLLISDDCSTDGSLDIIRKYMIIDSRVRLVSSGVKFGSAKSNFMNLFQYANSDLVMTCDQDDVWDGNKIKLTLDAMKLENSCMPVLVATDLRVVDESLNVLSDSFLTNSKMDASKTSFGYFLASCLVTGCTMMVNRPLLDLLKRPCNLDKIMMHDWWASLVASCFGKVVYLPIQTISYRQHSANSVGAVAFSFTNAISSLKDRRLVARECVMQASELLRVFPDMPSDKYESASVFSEILNGGGYTRIAALSRCDCWRKGMLRNLATAISFLSA